MTPTPSILRGGIALNEVLVNPNGNPNFFDTDGNGNAVANDEFVELYNLSSNAIDLGGLQLWDKGLRLWFTFPPETILPAGKFAVVVGGIQAGGSLPDLPAGNLAFDAGRGGGVINNGGDNVVLYDPDTDEYVQFAFNGVAADDLTTYNGFSPTATRVGAIEDWGNDTDGISLGRTSDGNTNIFSHNDFGSIRLASPGATNLTLTPIHKIQGDGASSPVTGSVFEIEAIVVGDFQGNEELQGFFLQEEDTDADGNPATSDGIFVLHDAVDVAVGDKVRLVGEVGERSGQTAIENVSHIEILDSGNPLPNTTTRLYYC